MGGQTWRHQKENQKNDRKRIAMKHTRILFIALMAICASSCAPKKGLRSGDLVFQANIPNYFTSAIESSTKTEDEEYSFSHVGIVEVDGDSTFVIEALGKKGVVRTPMSMFLEESEDDADGQPMVRFYRVNVSSKLAAEAVERAKTHLGKKYDYAFAPGDEDLYCSELVYECFFDKNGEHVFELAPMNFKDSTGAISPLWVEFFEKHGGGEVPQDVPGTNPNTMSHSEALTPVEP